MAFTAKAVANELIDLAHGSDLSPMKLQKLVYYAHGWSLAINEEALIKEDFEAWQFGPVVPDLYHEFKNCGARGVKTFATRISPFTGEWVIPRIRSRDDGDSASSALEVIRDVWKNYRSYSATKLSNATHMEGTPWSQVYVPCSRSIPIPNQLIKEYFKGLMDEQREI